MNPVFAMVQSGLLDSSGWSVYLNPDKSAINAGQLILGGNDTSLYTGDLKSYAVLEPLYALLPLIGNDKISTCWL